MTTSTPARRRNSRVLAFLALSLLGATVPAQPCVNRVDYGQAARQDTIAAMAQKNCYLLNGAIGDLLRITYWSNFAAVVEVIDPLGNQVCFGNWDRNQIDCPLTMAGDHKIVVYSHDLTRTGTYWFGLQRLNDPVGCEPFCYGNKTTETIDSPADVDCYTFPGTANNTVRIVQVSNFAAVFEVLDPSGVQVCFANWDRPQVDCVLPVTGAYTLLVRSHDMSRVGTYTVGLECRSGTCECTAQYWNYGQGWPGTNGVPTLTATGVPKLGTGIDLPVSNSLGQDTDAFLLLGFSRVQLDLGFGGTFLVGAPLSIIPFRMPGAGVRIPFGVPNNTALCNVCAHLQVIEVDAGASHGLSFTSGLTLVLGM